MTADPTMAIVLAVDGGNSKTDLALVAADGRVLSLVRGPLSSPHHLGVDGSVEVLDGLFRQAVAEAGIDNGNGAPVAAVARLCMAGVDFPAEEDVLQKRIARLGWAEATSVANDTFAVLRAGTESGWGVAIVCGAGINCVGVGPDGRQVRFAALGELSGDWGGGYDVGMAAVSAAARSEDGRGPETSLERAVPAHFGLAKPQDLTEAIHTGKIERRRVLELPPIVFAEAECDEVAAGIVERVAAEIVDLARAALTRLELQDDRVEVALAGGLIRSMDGRVLDLILEELRAVAPKVELRPTAAPPVIGAALYGLDQIGADVAAHDLVREQLAASPTNRGANHG
jgi:N-acetylglucosamine kinase-like BadF-type ATPase